MFPPKKDPIWLSFLPSSIRQRLMGRINLHKALHNTSWLLFDKVLRALLGVGVGAWLARYLGPSQFGELAYCIAFISIFQAISNLGLDGIVVRELSRDKNKANMVLGTVLQMRLLVGCFCWILAVLIFYLFNRDDTHLIVLVIIVGGSLVFQAADTVDLWFQSQVQSRRTVLAKACAYIISNGIKIALILMHAPLIAFAIVVASEAAMNAFALFLSYRSYPCKGGWQIRTQISKTLLRESWPYIISGLSIMIYMRIDQIMIKNILNDAALGLYAAMLPLSNIWNVIPITICSSIAPIMARKKIQGDQHFDEALLFVFRSFWLISVSISFITIFFSPLLIQLLYGESYKEVSGVLNIYILTNIPIFLGVAQSLWLLNQRRSYISVIQTLSGAVISICGNLLLLPIFGLKGAAISAVTSQIFSAMLINGFFSKELFLMQMGIRSKGSSLSKKD